MIFKYPYTDLHSINLDWILREVKSMRETIEEFRVTLVKYGDITEEVEVLSQKVDDFENHLNEVIDTLNDRIDSRIIEFYPEIQSYVNSLIAVIAKDVRDLSDAFDALQNTTNVSLTEMQSTIRENKLDTDATIESYRQAMELEIAGLLGSTTALVEEVDHRLSQRIDDLEFSLPDVHNLVQGVMTSIQQYIDDVYNALRYNALSNDEYTALDLTNDVYASFGISNIEYAVSAKTLLNI